MDTVEVKEKRPALVCDGIFRLCDFQPASSFSFHSCLRKLIVHSNVPELSPFLTPFLIMFASTTGSMPAVGSIQEVQPDIRNAVASAYNDDQLRHSMTKLAVPAQSNSSYVQTAPSAASQADTEQALLACVSKPLNPLSSDNNNENDDDACLRFNVDDLLDMGAYDCALIPILTTLSKFDWGPVQRATSDYASREDILNFVRFLAMKCFDRDLNAMKMSPSGNMDAIWHAAILDTRFYESVCSAVGHPIHHRPEGEHEQDRFGRYTRTVALFKMCFNIDLEEQNTVHSDHAISDTASSAPTDTLAETAETAETVSTFAVQVQNMNSTSFTVIVSPQTTVLEIKTMICARDGLPQPKQQVLVYAHKRLENHETVQSAHINANSVLYKLPRLSGC